MQQIPYILVMLNWTEVGIIVGSENWTEVVVAGVTVLEASIAM